MFGKIFNYLQVFIVVEFLSRFVLERVIYYAEKITSKSQYFKSILSLKQYFPLCADNFKTVYRAGIRKIILCRSNVQSRHLSSQA